MAAATALALDSSRSFPVFPCTIVRAGGFGGAFLAVGCRSSGIECLEMYINVIADRSGGPFHVVVLPDGHLFST